MNSEIIVEEGIVISVEKGFANVAVVQGESCNECSAKIICKPKSADEKIIKVIDSFGVKSGDKIHFEVKGGELLSASFSLYGVPLILLFVGILSGLSIFSQFKAKELFAFLFAAGLIMIYFFLTFWKSEKANKQIMPRIISVNNDVI